MAAADLSGGRSEGMPAIRICSRSVISCPPGSRCATSKQAPQRSRGLRMLQTGYERVARQRIVARGLIRTCLYGQPAAAAICHISAHWALSGTRRAFSG